MEPQPNERENDRLDIVHHVSYAPSNDLPSIPSLLSFSNTKKLVSKNLYMRIESKDGMDGRFTRQSMAYTVDQVQAIISYERARLYNLEKKKPYDIFFDPNGL